MISRRDALEIARKLGADVREGGKHRLFIIRVTGQPPLQFGISRGGRDSNLSYIPRQLKINEGEAQRLANCSLGKEEYYTILYGKGFWKMPECC